MDTLNDDTAAYENTNNRVTALNASAMSWGAIFGGAVASASLSLILFILGIGLGLTTISPWSHEGISAGAFGLSAILWITFTAACASGLGGYLTGRLRSRWVLVHTDEVYFRDTAHGFISWGVATLVVAALFTSLMTSMVSGGAAVAKSVGGAALTATGTAADGASAIVSASTKKSENGSENNSMNYFLDSLFRKSNEVNNDINPQSADTTNNTGMGSTRNNRNFRDHTAVVAEVSRIFIRSFDMDTLPQNDLTYIGKLVSSYTGISQEQAETRVQQAFNTVSAELDKMETAARNAADEARKASATVSLWLFISLLIGAFTGSFAATFGGRQRDL